MGMTPNTNASAVIMIGRKRITPSIVRRLAYRLTLLAEIHGIFHYQYSILSRHAEQKYYAYLSIDAYALVHEDAAQHRAEYSHRSILSTTAIGSVQLSYWADSTSSVITMANISTKLTVVPDCVS